MHGLNINSVGKNFHEIPVLKDISLSVHSGEFVSILGPSGCGKSTLLRIIAGLEYPDHGDIVIAGTTVTHEPVWKRRIGFVFQNFALWPHLSVLRNVSMGLELRGIERQERLDRALAALKMVQLEQFADRMPTQLSGGQQQRVAIARAIVLEPSLLLLDEPLSALDKHLRQDMQVELKALQQKLQVTTVFVTHDQEEAMSLSDRIVVMNRGVVEQVDTPERIYNRPSSSYVARFVGETTFFEGALVHADNGTHLCTAAQFNIPLDDVSDDAGTGPAIAFVRPEWISLEKTLDADAMIGKVERIMYFGATRDYLIRHEDSLIRVKSTDTQRNLCVGDDVAISFVARLLPKG
ncbi:ABC transporter ATP-binding protein [Serratia entomophila]|jgi:ABC-type Fe3+/spermidine/putrescine transport system ATPase subunit|uniref:ABC transporter ATP-binding protein n=1 Tax=Serratia entomophila TaxID=42906 RepID=UPI0021773703|nr:ABC transporter ATP-binding protein [Serratia entomophila]CAI1162268.1 Spermidine/putrescine import ATP-binding protein PotA [Serratia entomophila]CAI1787608.1 Spermidine/putrescine import ATP-binding protein PotA [Serratia entomophila]CAI1910159.1 Spermidine/putrescine import ATP-binding protein PotA [Serratia entomophila]CAI1911157.1 Spermidine/putrescine import ATP-binding protein PotA [Serratia entomophila]CAI1992518.1 Spermidine/putrescine import ATP-binding protein PotA [Serratia ento